MRRTAFLMLVMLCTGIASYADHLGKGKDDKGTAMAGWLCNSKCVKASEGKSSCDQSCTATDGEVVFIDSHGVVDNIANQDMVKSHSGKKVKMMATMNKDSHMLEVHQVVQEYAGP
jgi:hypothetical protein